MHILVKFIGELVASHGQSNWFTPLGRARAHGARADCMCVPKTGS